VAERDWIAPPLILLPRQQGDQIGQISGQFTLGIFFENYIRSPNFG
jgi:hypothetical protein